MVTHPKFFFIYCKYIFSLLSRRHPYTFTFTFGDTQNMRHQPKQNKMNQQQIQVCLAMAGSGQKADRVSEREREQEIVSFCLDLDKYSSRIGFSIWNTYQIHNTILQYLNYNQPNELTAFVLPK